MTNKTYDGTLSPDGKVVLHNAELPNEEMRVLVTVLGPHSAGPDVSPPMTFESYLRTMPDVGDDNDFSRIEGSMREIDLAD